MECSDSSDDDSRLPNGHTLNFGGGAATYQQATLANRDALGMVSGTSVDSAAPLVSRTPVDSAAPLVSRTSVESAAPLTGPSAMFEGAVVAAQSFDWSSDSKRRETFRAWQISDTEKEKFVRAGFYYTGAGDRVKCFKCSGELEHWKPGDDPIKEHGEKFPNCTLYREETSARRPSVIATNCTGFNSGRH
ncbi:unnamed protein product [Lymnaea stagnalis]|uniref:Uncharacterized protein n=1 Tax=Lymnaea stagnalis TaxID=6523 RepID=A0AAV2II85_LYMST